MDVDLRGVLLGMKHGIRAMLEAGNGGAIVNWSSIGGPQRRRPSPACTRPRRPGSSRSPRPPRSSTARKGIRANAICPGFIHTEIERGRREHPRHPREGRAGPRRPAGGGRRGRRVPRVGPGVVRHRRRSSRSTAAGPPSSRELAASHGEVRPVRVPRAGRPSPTPSHLLAELGEEAKVLAGGQSLIPMLALRLAVLRPPRRHRPHRASCRASSGATASSGSAPGPPRPRSRRERRGRGRGAAAREGDAVHRPLPDPQPRHARRIDRARRSRGRVPGRRADARRDAWRSSRRGPPHDRGARLLRRPVEHQHGARRAARRRVVPGLGRAERLRGRGVRPPPRRLRDRGRDGRRRARRRRPDPALRHRPDRPGVDARARRRPPRPRSPGRPIARRRRRRRSGRLAMAGLTSVPADLHGSAEYRTRVGAAMVARAWTTRRRGGAPMHEVPVQLTVNGQSAKRDRRSRA